MPPRKIVHRTPPKPKRKQPAADAPAKPTIIVTAKSRQQIDRERRRAQLRERGY